VGGDGSGFAASFLVAGGALEAITVTSAGSGYSYEAGLEVVVSSGGLGCEGLVLHARLRALRLPPDATSIVVNKVGKLGLVIGGKRDDGSDGPSYDFSIEAASVGGTSAAVLLEGVTILPFPQRLESFAVVPGSVSPLGFELAWSPPVPLRLSLSFDGGVNFLRHPQSPFSTDESSTEVKSFINALGVQEALQPGAAYLLQACPYDASRAADAQQRPDGCSFLHVNLAYEMRGVEELQLQHINTTSVKLRWRPPPDVPPELDLVYALEVAVVQSLAPTPYSPQYYRIGAAWEDLQLTTTSFTLTDLAAVAAFAIALPQKDDARGAGGEASTTPAPINTSTPVTTSPSPSPDAVAQHLSLLTSAFGGRARILLRVAAKGRLWRASDYSTVQAASLLLRLLQRPELPTGASLVYDLQTASNTVADVVVSWQVLGGRDTEAAITGYAIYTAYAQSPQLPPQSFRLYALVPTQLDQPTGDTAAAAWTFAAIDSAGRARMKVDWRAVSDASGGAIGAPVAAAHGGDSWPGIAWLRVVPFSDAGEARSKGAPCQPNVCAPLAVMPLAPPQAPTELIAAALGDGRVALSWRAPPQPDLLAHELVYRISYAPLLGEAGQGKGTSRLRPAAPFTIALEGKSTSVQVEVQGISVGAHVLFQVQARNLNSGGYRSDSKAEAAVQLDASVGPVRSLQVFHTSSTSISVSWGAPAWYISEFSLTIFRLLGEDAWSGVGVVSRAGDILASEQSVRGKFQAYTFTDLRPNTSYLISVTAHSLLVGEGRVQAVNISTRTHAWPADAPYGLRALRVGADTMALLWQHSKAASVSITHFRIFVNASNNGHGSMLASESRNKVVLSMGADPPGAGGLVLGGLTPSTEYVVSVAACGLGGCSDYHSRSVWTAPYAPLGFSVTAIRTVPPDISAALQWTAPCAVTLEADQTYPDGQGNPGPTCPAQVTSWLDMRYVVSYRRIVTSSSFTPWEAETSSDGGGREPTIKLTGLTIGSDYQARLVATFQGMRSEPVFLTVKITSQPLSVEDFGVAPDSHHGVLDTSLTMRWRAPGASAVSHYRLSWSKIHEIDSNSGRVGAYIVGGGGLGNAQSGVLDFDMRLHNEFANSSVGVQCARGNNMLPLCMPTASAFSPGLAATCLSVLVLVRALRLLPVINATESQSTCTSILTIHVVSAGLHLFAGDGAHNALALFL
jgi:hypothetical protein